MDLQPTLVSLRIRGGIRRYLLTSPPVKPHYGYPVFDLMAFFGFGSGELHSTLPSEFEHLRLRVEELPKEVSAAKSIIAYTMSKPTDKFSGFFTRDCQTFYQLIEDPEGSPIYKLKELDWSYYTAIGGNRDVAVSHLMSLNRRHITFDTHEQQTALFKGYCDLINAF